MKTLMIDFYLHSFRKHIEGWFMDKDRDRDGELTWDEVLGKYQTMFTILCNFFIKHIKVLCT